MMLDFHTHHLLATDALISVSPTDFAPMPGKCYAVGIHPWHTEGDVEAQMQALAETAQNEQVKAIGETGLDSLRGAPLEVQMRLFERHIALAEALGKPLVIHCVRTSQQVLKAWSESRKSVAWAIHGFRGNARVVAPLVKASDSMPTHFAPCRSTASLPKPTKAQCPSDKSSANSPPPSRCQANGSKALWQPTWHEH